MSEEKSIAVRNAIVSVTSDPSMLGDGTYLTDEGWKKVFQIVYSEPPRGDDDSRWDELLDCHSLSGLCGYRILNEVLDAMHRQP